MNQTLTNAEKVILTAVATAYSNIRSKRRHWTREYQDLATIGVKVHLTAWLRAAGIGGNVNQSRELRALESAGLVTTHNRYGYTSDRPRATHVRLTKQGEAVAESLQGSK